MKNSKRTVLQKPRDNKTSSGRGLQIVSKAAEIREVKKGRESLQLGQKGPAEISVKAISAEHRTWIGMNLVQRKRKECMTTNVNSSVWEFGKEGKQTRVDCQL